MTVSATSTTTGTTPALSANSATSTSSTTATSSTKSSSSSSSLGAAAGMGKDDFLKLLMAQLQNQDPMKPMEDKEFITQLAQFSSLEATQKMTDQLEEMNGAQMLIQAATLIGKQVSAKLEDGTVLTGPITQVHMIDGKPMAVVQGREIDTSLITSVSN
jgi:flagellar basal-body rod modification protein FlgD